MGIIPFPNKKYKVIYADPPWLYHQHKEILESKYPTMTPDEIKNLPVRDISEGDCALFLWTTWPNVPQAIEVIKAWGFEYKTIGFLWVKLNKKIDTLFWGNGYWTRSNTEPCLLAVKGKPKRVSGGVHSVVMAKRGVHSEKPSEVRDRIVKLMGDVTKIELFARHVIPNWDSWGDQLPQ